MYLVSDNSMVPCNSTLFRCRPPKTARIGAGNEEHLDNNPRTCLLRWGMRRKVLVIALLKANAFLGGLQFRELGLLF